MPKQKQSGRRRFLAGVGVVTAAGIAVKLSQPSTTSDAAAAPSEPEGDSYRLTEHIKKYYRTTTI